MTMGEKLIQLRKRECWTQDDLAEKLDVSRQSVSKWEGDLAAPAIDKLLELSRLYGVSTDYLLKDEMDLPGAAETAAPEEPALRQVTLAEAEAFTALKEASAKPFAGMPDIAGRPGRAGADGRGPGHGTGPGCPVRLRDPGGGRLRALGDEAG